MLIFDFKRFIIFTSLVLVSSGCTAVEDHQVVTYTQQTASPEISARQFVNLRLRGFNLDLQSPPLQDNDFRAMASTGANLARAPIRVNPACATCSEYVVASNTWAYMDGLVAAGNKYGFKIVFVLVPVPGGPAAQYWHNPALQTGIANVWTQITQHFRGNGTVAGFDILNEPVPPVQDGAQAAAMWHNFAIQLIQAIRNADPNRMVVVEPAPWADANALPFLIPLPFSNVLYSIHFYAPLVITHQGINGNPNGLSYPSGIWNKTWLSAQLQPVRNWVARYQLPLYVGEFSIARWAPGNSRANYLNDTISLFEAEKWPWTYHAFRSSPMWDAEYPGDLPQSTLTSDWKNRASYRDENTSAIQILRAAFRQNAY